MRGIALVWDWENHSDLTNSLALKGYRVLGVIDDREAEETICRHRPELIVHRSDRTSAVASMIRSATPAGGSYRPHLNTAQGVWSE